LRHQFLLGDLDLAPVGVTMTLDAGAAFRVGDALKFHKGDYMEHETSMERVARLARTVVHESDSERRENKLIGKGKRQELDTDRVTVSTAVISRCSQYDGHSQQCQEDVHQ